MTSNNNGETGKSTHKPLIGGPGTILPRPIESFLSWTLCLSCLAVSGYHYITSTFVKPALARWKCLASTTNSSSVVSVWLPITTYTRAEVSRASPSERLDQLSSLLTKLGLTTSIDTTTSESLTRLIRSNESCRRLASLAMRSYNPYNVTGDDVPSAVSSSSKKHHSEWKKKLATVWRDLLALPSPDHGGPYLYEISLVVPLYYENVASVLQKLDRARRNCDDPSRVEVILVDASSSTTDDVTKTQKGWGHFTIVNHTGGGGRGPCLNTGASAARGHYLTFCHADTTLPSRWDTSVVTAFRRETSRRANSCAFSFGIDTSPPGLNGGAHPPGIRAVVATAHVRSRLYSLPYGDQVLSVPSEVFRHVGGFPYQCLMEDYELVSLLRRRCALGSRFFAEKEKLEILAPRALCSPRRWQKFGVLYVTFMNSKFVNLYAGGMTADDLYGVYYGKGPPETSTELSPWEVELVTS